MCKQRWDLGNTIRTLVYLVAEKISSNFFFRVAASPSGQLLSSWCTNTTFSKMALETPIMSGTVAFMSAHFRETLTRSPVFSSSVCEIKKKRQSRVLRDWERDSAGGL